MKGFENMTETEVLRIYGRKVISTGPARFPDAISKPVGPIPATIQPRMSKGRVDLADVLLGQLTALGMPIPVRDHVFHPVRRWKMDLAWLEFMVSCEVDGNEWAQTNGTKGRHGGAKGMQSDCEKQNEALLLGWKPYRFTGSQVRSGYAVGILEKALRALGAMR